MVEVDVVSEGESLGVDAAAHAGCLVVGVETHLREVLPEAALHHVAQAFRHLPPAALQLRQLALHLLRHGNAR